MNQPTKRRLAGLDVYQIGNEPKAPYVILFHGYGANAFDLMPLSQALLSNCKVNWLFPDGCIDVDLGYGMMGKAWFQIDVVALQEAMMRGEYRDLSQGLPDGFERARELGQNMLAELNIPMGQIVLGGFSQGSMLATALALQAAKPAARLVILSGTLIDESNLRKIAKRREGMPFFQSHGSSDPLLPHAAAQKLHQILSDAGLAGEWHGFQGGHEIPQNVLLQLNAFLERVAG